MPVQPPDLVMYSHNQFDDDEYVMQSMFLEKR